MSYGPLACATALVGRTPWSAADALVGLCESAQQAGQGAGCGPGGPPHQTARHL
jgi:hypothetical protein